ncbi:MAG: galactose mutarotase [Planctomycetales bacterium]|jgi:aldose 1-epimerase|nr:galactose mutarotase [Planctomycetales bacterium]
MAISIRQLAVMGLVVGCGLAVVGCEAKVTKSSSGKTGSKTVGPAAHITTQAEIQDEPMTTVQREPFGQTVAGEEVVQYSLRNRSGMKVSLINLGATITSVEVPDRDGISANVTLRFPDCDGYSANAPYFGGACGRYANRIANGKFQLDGNDYSLVINNAPNHLHGGTVGFNKKLWKGETFQGDNFTGVKFTYVSPDNEEGYPGTLKTIVTYSLTDNNELAIDYAATTDKPTVLNLTNHAYWNLTGTSGETILDHELTLFCDKYLPVDQGSIPTGELLAVTATCMDFTHAEPIGSRIDQPVNGSGGYDHCYIVNGSPGTLRPAAKIVDKKSGRVMEIATTEPAIQFYTGNYLNGTPETGNALMHGAFCLESQHYPDSPNRPEFPTTRLNPGETYHQTTVHKFSVIP